MELFPGFDDVAGGVDEDQVVDDSFCLGFHFSLFFLAYCLGRYVAAETISLKESLSFEFAAVGTSHHIPLVFIPLVFFGFCNRFGGIF